MDVKDSKKPILILKEIGEWILYLFLALIIVIFINSEVFSLTVVSGASMEHTYKDGDKLFLDKVSYKFSKPKTGDNIVFLQGELINGFGKRVTNVVADLKNKFTEKPRRNRFVKRVIGLPGDKIDIKDGKVYINDSLIEEDYAKGTTYGITMAYPAVVPEGKLFVMGDNRENSNDSRSFGFVDFKSVEGKIRLKVWPLKKR